MVVHLNIWFRVITSRKTSYYDEMRYTALIDAMGRIAAIAYYLLELFLSITIIISQIALKTH